MRDVVTFPWVMADEAGQGVEDAEDDQHGAARREGEGQARQGHHSSDWGLFYAGG